ncbi:class I SAM-dependent methyltransferase [Modestobacter sp. NPDC049651]|uniref:O-methyltransferase n=1 Tax=unclassified Modestobacter TaxID=2643866 RepID=UPI0033FCD12C
MPEDFDTVAAALHAEGVRHDAQLADRTRRRRNLDPEAAELLSVVCRAMGARGVVEIGTSNGYSTLWLARAAEATGGTVLSVDLDAAAQQEAAATLDRVGLRHRVELRRADGGAVLRGLADGSQDVVLLDSERTEYAGWWPDPVRVLRPGGLLAIDNVLSHPAEVADVRARIAADPAVTATVAPIGKGLLLAVRDR